ncbi:hypothetical protein DES53_11384 [Roseimicrobium gellanilyticum]|uniref:KTSC domain-containing protein n=1 Tax=Roseimicrobium gellanilyticum TaxID=748857 RepID=A0A366H874_9BACT|nr:hypothetical protein [Roseimicrobium gellanilyticum]RBP37702.1 hypothetical protein DES53_11384 [Roseimicrobium gellanilyticum]
MKRYVHRGGKTGVAAFESGPRSITIRFQDGSTYRYTYAKTGAQHVEAMKELATGGKGLATYINQRVRGDYAARLV